MPYLNLSLDYFDHRKTKRLIGLLGRGAEVLPIRLWSYCGKFHCEDGKLTGYSEQEIESLVGWWGEKGALLPAMQKAEFMRQGDDGNWEMVSWLEHEGHIAAFKLKGKAMAEARWNGARNAASMLPASSEQCPNRASPTEPVQPTNRTNQIDGAAAPPVQEALSLSVLANQAQDLAKHGFYDEFGNEIPLKLRTVEFLSVLREWHAYKRQRREGYKPIGAKNLLGKLDRLGEVDFVVTCVKDCMGSNYQGVWASNSNRRHAAAKPAPGAQF